MEKLEEKSSSDNMMEKQEQESSDNIEKPEASDNIEKSECSDSIEKSLDNTEKPLPEQKEKTESSEEGERPKSSDKEEKKSLESSEKVASTEEKPEAIEEPKAVAENTQDSDDITIVYENIRRPGPSRASTSKRQSSTNVEEESTRPKRMAPMDLSSDSESESESEDFDGSELSDFEEEVNDTLETLLGVPNDPSNPWVLADELEDSQTQSDESDPDSDMSDDESVDEDIPTVTLSSDEEKEDGAPEGSVAVAAELERTQCEGAEGQKIEPTDLLSLQFSSEDDEEELTLQGNPDEGCKNEESTSPKPAESTVQLPNPDGNSNENVEADDDEETLISVDVENAAEDRA